MAFGMQHRVEAYLADDAGLRGALGLDADARISCHPLAQGEHNENYWFETAGDGRRFVLRVNHFSQMGLANQIRYEFACLEELAQSGCTPQPLYCDEAGIDGHGVLVESFEEGRQLDFEQPGDLAAAARAMADVHAVVPSAQCALLGPGDALADLHAECRRMFERYRTSALAEDWLVRIVEHFFSCVAPDLAVAPDPAECNHVLNTEPVPSHFLVRAGEDGRPVAAFVDWDKPVLGEVTRDVAYFTAPTTTIWDTDFMFTPEERAAFVEEYWRAVDGRFARGRFDERFRAYLRMNCLRGTTWSCMAWVDYHDPSHALKNEKTRALLDTYLSPDFLDMLRRDFFEA